MTAMLSGVAVVGSLTEAMDLVAARPRLRAVTRDGDLVGAGWVSGGSDRQPVHAGDHLRNRQGA